MGKLRNLAGILMMSFIVCNSSDSMEDKAGLSTEEIVTEVVRAYENSLSGIRSILINDKIRFYRKHENLDSPINMVSISLLDNEETASLTIDYVKHWAEKLKGLLEWRVVPTTTPSNMGEILIRNGFSLSATSQVMIYDLHKEIANQPSSESISVERLSSIEIVPAWTKITQRAFDFFWGNEHAYQQYIEKGISIDTAMPGSAEYYSGYYENQLVATGGLFIGDICGHIYSVTTDRLFRRKGLATQMTLTLLNRAKALGLKYVILQCDSTTVNLYTKIGFKKAFDMEIYCL